jgi:hypothetical protein
MIYDKYSKIDSNLNLSALEDFKILPFRPYCTIGLNINYSVEMHKDWEGDPNGMECIIVIGDWTNGGHLVLEDVKAIVTIRSGDVYFLNSANVFHQVTPFEGTRYSLVQFTDHVFVK